MAKETALTKPESFADEFNAMVSQLMQSRGERMSSALSELGLPSSLSSFAGKAADFMDALDINFSFATDNFAFTTDANGRGGGGGRMDRATKMIMQSLIKDLGESQKSAIVRVQNENAAGRPTMTNSPMGVGHGGFGPPGSGPPPAPAFHPGGVSTGGGYDKDMWPGSRPGGRM